MSLAAHPVFEQVMCVRDLEDYACPKERAAHICPVCNGTGQHSENFDVSECKNKDLWLIMHGLNIDLGTKQRALTVAQTCGARGLAQVHKALAKIISAAQEGTDEIRNPSRYLTRACDVAWLEWRWL